MSVDAFEKHVQPFVNIVRVGSAILIPPSELERWAREHEYRVRDDG